MARRVLSDDERRRAFESKYREYESEKREFDTLINGFRFAPEWPLIEKLKQYEDRAHMEMLAAIKVAKKHGPGSKQRLEAIERIEAAKEQLKAFREKML